MTLRSQFSTVPVLCNPSLVQSINGEILLQSSRDKQGTQFLIRLPFNMNDKKYE
uniref:Histidine kinase n=1 Tax=Magnetococcus massalia (strain MO-1) TaxID=451514 RepID=A0A1S7LGL6_MAGMO|nr:protein of unknown function [Candidatus Magnetococcus massalia]